MKKDIICAIAGGAAAGVKLLVAGLRHTEYRALTYGTGPDKRDSWWPWCLKSHQNQRAVRPVQMLSQKRNVTRSS